MLKVLRISPHVSPSGMASLMIATETLMPSSISAPIPEPVELDQMVPRRTSVVVIGGGIIGVSTAYWLALSGVPVVLCEKGRIAGEQSSRNWGWVRQQGRDPREIPMSIESRELWQGMNERVGSDVGYRSHGILYLERTEKALAAHEVWLKQAIEHGLDSKFVAGADLEHILPGSAAQFHGALYTASDGRAEPQLATPAIARAARALGAIIVSNCAVRGIEKQAGRVCGVITEQGSIACESVVLAGGAWSRLFCGNLDLDLPQLKVRSSVLRTAPLSGGPEAAALGDSFAFRKRLDGGYTVANGVRSVAEIVPDSFRLFSRFLPALRSEWRTTRLHFGAHFLDELRTPRHWSLDSPTVFERNRVLDPAPMEGENAATLRALARTFPAFASARVAQQWAGFIDVTPDEIPVMDGIDAVPGFFIATGFSGHGFGIAPSAGRLMADLVTGQTPAINPHPFRFSRFAE